jgi:hypothetical protein
MNHLYKVEFEVKYSGISEWIGDETVHVIANGDGMKAIAKARKIALKKEFIDGDGSERWATNVRVVGLKQLQQIDA